MDGRPHPDDLARLRAELATLRAAHDALHRRVARRRRRGPALALAPALALGLLLALVPLALLAAPTFSDLDAAAPEHRTNILLVGQAGIATGYADPDHPGQRLFDPKGLVTREEMASFLARAAGLGADPPVATAARLAPMPDAGRFGYHANDLVRVAQSPTDPGFIYLPDGAVVGLPVAVATITTPHPGFLLVSASATFAFSTDCTDCFASARIGSVQTGALEEHLPVMPIALTFVVPVPVPGVQSLPLLLSVGGTSPSGRLGTVSSPRVTALYVPFGATGTNYAP